MIAAAQDQFRQGQPQPYNNRPEGEQRNDESFDDDGGDDFQAQGEPGYGNRGEPQAPYPPRDNQYQPREYQNRDQQQPQYNREQQQPSYPREQQPPRPPQQQPQPQPPSDIQGDVAGLPSFITGGAPQPQASNFSPNGQNGQNGHEGQGDRFPLHRRRRRHRGPRTDAPAGSEGTPPAPRPTNE
jgi:hypothetical protein